MTTYPQAKNTPHFDYPSLPLTFDGYSVRGNKSSIKSMVWITPHDYPSKSPMRGNILHIFQSLRLPLTTTPPYGGGSPSLVVRGNPVRGNRPTAEKV